MDTQKPICLFLNSFRSIRYDAREFTTWARPLYRIILPRVKRNFLKRGNPTANDDAADERGKRTIFLDIAGDET